MGVTKDAIEYLYTIAADDPETASGGPEPTNSDSGLHAGRFTRIDRKSIEELEGPGIDRVVQVDYLGTEQPGKLGHPIEYHRHALMRVRVGYYVGDHVADSQGIIGDDEHRLFEALGRERSGRPTGLMGIYPLRSEITEIDAQRRILEIDVKIEIIGSP